MTALIKKGYRAGKRILVYINAAPYLITLFTIGAIGYYLSLQYPWNLTRKSKKISLSISVVG